MSQFANPPQDVSGGLSPFTFTVSDQEIKTLNAFLAHPLPRASFENTTAELLGFGVSRQWLAEAVEAWKTFDWQVLASLIVMKGPLCTSQMEKRILGQIETRLLTVRMQEQISSPRQQRTPLQDSREQRRGGIWRALCGALLPQQRRCSNPLNARLARLVSRVLAHLDQSPGDLRRRPSVLAVPSHRTLGAGLHLHGTWTQPGRRHR